MGNESNDLVAEILLLHSLAMLEPLAKETKPDYNAYCFGTNDLSNMYVITFYAEEVSIIHLFQTETLFVEDHLASKLVDIIKSYDFSQATTGDVFDLVHIDNLIETLLNRLNK